MKSEFEKAKHVLQNSGILAFKTDTVMGLAVNAFDKFAVKKLFDLKGRDYNKPSSTIMYSVSNVFQYASVSENTFRIIKTKFPGAITCIMKAKIPIYTTPLKVGKTIGVRIPCFIELLEFLSLLPFPLIATSANFSGEKPLTTKEDILSVFKKTVYFLDFEYNIKMSGIASTVADCSKEPIRILREGSVKL